MRNARFLGPLFLVGMPRSGTKLIRDLLNRNPQIGIPIVESDFIPYMVSRFGMTPDFTSMDIVSAFYKELTKTVFYYYMQEEGRLIAIEYIRDNIHDNSWADILETLFRYYAPRKRAKQFIWGDKTPGYLNHMSLLKKLCPNAKFLHIIRDPRDYCLSCKKAWGKSMYRAAARWADSIANARTQSKQLGCNYMEINYEALLDNPQGILRQICQFIECDFKPEMMSLDKPAENLGDTQSRKDIVKENKHKYLNNLSRKQLRRIEMLVCKEAIPAGYMIETDVKFLPLSPIMSNMLKLYDGWACFRFRIKERGLRKTFLSFPKEYFRGSLRSF